MPSPGWPEHKGDGFNDLKVSAINGGWWDDRNSVKSFAIGGCAKNGKLTGRPAKCKVDEVFITDAANSQVGWELRWW